jgi:ribose transport system substrate-binding protein
VQAAESAIQPFEGTPSSIGQTQPLKALPTGKTIDVISNGTPIGGEVLAGVAQASKVLGVSLKIIQGGVTPQALTVAWNQVAANPPAAVVSAGDPASLIGHQLEELRAKHVPVIELFTANSPLFAADLFSNAQYAQLGRLEADYIIAKSNGKAHILIVAVPQLSALQGVAATIEQTVKSGCSGCTVSTIDTQLSDIAKNDPGRVVSYMQQNPSTNWIAFIDPDSEIGVPQALKAAQVNGVQMLSGGGGPVNYAYIKSGAATADASQSPVFAGWALMDAAARVLAGQPVHVSMLPLQFITQPDVTFNINSGWPDVPGYQQKFTALWGAHH